MILVCAATRTEAAECRRGIADAGARDIDVLTTGVGPARAADALRRRLEDRRRPGRPALVVSSGFAGAITGGLEPVEWVTASAVYGLAGGRAVRAAIRPEFLRVLAGATPCEVLSADGVVAAAVAGLGGPVAVDMESAALGEVASAAGVPFAVLRLVTDTPDHPAPPIVHAFAAALAAEAPSRRIARGARIVLEAVRAPVGTASFLRDTTTWRQRLRSGWRERARHGLHPAAPDQAGGR